MTKQPKIGIFWIYKSKVYLKSIEPEKVKAIGTFVDSDFAHYEAWDEISFQNKDLYLYEYEDIPRGRIVFNSKDACYIVYSNNEIIHSDTTKQLIIDAFDLQNEKVSFQYDFHYEIEPK